MSIETKAGSHQRTEVETRIGAGRFRDQQNSRRCPETSQTFSMGVPLTREGRR